jgi:plasmid maintenance system antidote protein VapI
MGVYRVRNTVSGKAFIGTRAITADTDLRLCRFFGLSSGYWLRAQAAFDTEVAQAAPADTLKRITPWGARERGRPRHEAGAPHLRSWTSPPGLKTRPTR